MIRNDHKVISVAAIVGGYRSRALSSVRAAGVHVQISTLGDSARHVLMQTEDGHAASGFVLGIVINVYTELALTLEESGKMQTAVLARCNFQAGHISSFGINMRSGLRVFVDLYGVYVTLLKCGMRAERLDRDLLLAVAQKRHRKNVIIVKYSFHSFTPIFI